MPIEQQNRSSMVVVPAGPVPSVHLSDTDSMSSCTAAISFNPSTNMSINNNQQSQAPNQQQMRTQQPRSYNTDKGLPLSSGPSGSAGLGQPVSFFPDLPPPITSSLPQAQYSPNYVALGQSTPNGFQYQNHAQLHSWQMAQPTVQRLLRNSFSNSQPERLPVQTPSPVAIPTAITTIVIQPAPELEICKASTVGKPTLNSHHSNSNQNGVETPPMAPSLNTDLTITSPVPTGESPPSSPQDGSPTAAINTGAPPPLPPRPSKRVPQ